MARQLEIIMVTDVLPDPNFTGGQVLEKIIEHTPFADFKIFWINQSKLPAVEKLNSRVTLMKKLDIEPHTALRKLRSGLVRLCGLFSAPLQEKVRRLLDLGLSLAAAGMLGIRLGLMLRKLKTDYVWLVLQGEKLTVAYHFICLLSGKKIIFQQWDPIKWWMSHVGHSERLINHISKIVQKIEKKAMLNLVPSESWRKLQLNGGAVSTRIDNFFVEGDICRNKPPVSETEFHAVFIGQFYSNDELQTLISILNKSVKKIGRKLVLHYFGAGNAQTLEPDVQIISHGFLPRQRVITKISEFDLALLPYPMDERFALASKYSFPSKSRVYLAAALPILSYCKGDSSPNLFFNECYSGYYKNVFVDADLIKFVQTCLEKSDFLLKKRTDLADRLVKENFSKEAELEPLHQILLAKALPKRA